MDDGGHEPPEAVVGFPIQRPPVLAAIGCWWMLLSPERWPWRTKRSLSPGWTWAGAAKARLAAMREARMDLVNMSMVIASLIERSPLESS
jgi:hypothetical protein